MTLLLRKILIGVVLVLMLGTGLIQMLNGFTSPYGTSISDDVSQSISAFNETVINETWGWTKGLQSETQTEQGIETVGGEIAFTASLFQIIKLPFNLLGYVWDMINEIPKTLGIPVWALTGFSTIIIIVFVMVIISPVFRKDT